jgi:hypothetical protein
VKTLLLDTGTWDLKVDRSGNIAVAAGAYAIAQDVASAARLFLGELWYDTAQGIPYLEQILGKLPSLQFMKAQYIAAALTVPDVASVKVFLTGPGAARLIGGQIQITDDTGALSVAQTAALQGGLPWYVSAASIEAES